MNGWLDWVMLSAHILLLITAALNLALLLGHILRESDKNEQN